MSASPAHKPIDETSDPFPPKRDFPNNLKAFLKEDTSSKDLFELAWKIVQECGEEERHFNQLQSVYRGLVSTWITRRFLDTRLPWMRCSGICRGNCTAP